MAKYADQLELENVYRQRSFRRGAQVRGAGPSQIEAKSHKSRHIWQEGSDRNPLIRIFSYYLTFNFISLFLDECLLSLERRHITRSNFFRRTARHLVPRERTKGRLLDRRDTCFSSDICSRFSSPVFVATFLSVLWSRIPLMVLLLRGETEPALDCRLAGVASLSSSRLSSDFLYEIIVYSIAMQELMASFLLKSTHQQTYSLLSTFSCSVRTFSSSCSQRSRDFRISLFTFTTATVSLSMHLLWPSFPTFSL